MNTSLTTTKRKTSLLGVLLAVIASCVLLCGTVVTHAFAEQTLPQAQGWYSFSQFADPGAEDDTVTYSFKEFGSPESSYPYINLIKDAYIVEGFTEDDILLPVEISESYMTEDLPANIKVISRVVMQESSGVFDKVFSFTLKGNQTLLYLVGDTDSFLAGVEMPEVTVDSQQLSSGYYLDDTDIGYYHHGSAVNNSGGITYLIGSPSGATRITVDKHWEGDTSVLPQSLPVVLSANGKKIDTVKLNADNGWAHVWNDLPKYDRGTKISYSLSEINVPGWLPLSAKSSSDADGNNISYSFTNIKPSITSVATDAEDGDKRLSNEGTATIKDVVEYKDLVDSKATYTLKGQVVKQSDRSVVATNSLDFTAENAVGSVEMTFDIDTSGLGGEKLVVYETLMLGDEVLADHSDINDSQQTVFIEEMIEFKIRLEKKIAPVTFSGEYNHYGRAATVNNIDDFKLEWEKARNVVEGEKFTFSLVLRYPDQKQEVKTYTLIGESNLDISLSVPVGTGYHIEETNSPAYQYSYANLLNQTQFTKHKTTPSRAVSNEVQTIQFLNIERTMIKPVFKKVDENGKPIEGAEFLFYSRGAVDYSSGYPKPVFTEIPTNTFITEFEDTLGLTFTQDGQAFAYKARTNKDGLLELPFYFTDYLLYSETEAPSGYLMPENIEFNSIEDLAQYLVSNNLVTPVFLSSFENEYDAALSQIERLLNLSNDNLEKYQPALSQNIFYFDPYYQSTELHNQAVMKPLSLIETYNTYDIPLTTEFPFVVVNTPWPTVEISKTAVADTTELPGAELVITKTDTGEEVARHISTNEPWKVSLEPGNYILAEVAAPEGYEVAESINFTVDRNGLVGSEKIHMEDAPKPVGFGLYKDWICDSSSTPPSVSFNFYADNELVETVVLNESNNWSHLWQDLPKYKDGKWITYKAEEVHLPGFLTTAKSFMDQWGNQSWTFYNVKPTLSSVATDASDGDKVLNNKGTINIKDVVKWDMDGFNGLLNGKTITLKGQVVKKSDGHVVATNEQNVVVEAGVTSAEVVFEIDDANAVSGETLVVYESMWLDGEELAIHNDPDDENQTVYIDGAHDISFAKTDLGGKEIGGAKIQVLDKDGKVVDEWVSVEGENHIITLEPGDYTMHEVSAPEGYFVATDIAFSVAANGSITCDSLKNGKVTMEDKPYPNISIVKTDAATSKELAGAKLTLTDAVGKVVDSWTSNGSAHIIERIVPGTYTLTEVSAPDGYNVAEAITFEVNEDGVEGDLIEMKDAPYVEVSFTKKVLGGEELEGAQIQVLDKDGKVVDEWTSTTESHVIALPDGEYVMHEVAAPHGFYVASDIPFTVEAGNAEASAVVNMDDAQWCEIEISKTDAATSKELEGATLQIHKVAEDGTTELIEEWVSTGESHKVRLEEGTYTLTEVSAPDGYNVAENIIFVVNREGLVEGEKVEMLDQPYTEVVFSKQDLGGKEIGGATIQILNAEGSVVAEWVSAEGQSHKVSLADGEYVMHEVSAPEGYFVATDIAFSVAAGSAENTTQVVMTDKPWAMVEISKVDAATSAELSGAKLTITNADGKVVDEWVSDGQTHKVQLAPGTYTLTEVNAPDGYEKAESITFEVNEDGLVGAEKVVMEDKAQEVVVEEPTKDTEVPTEEEVQPTPAPEKAEEPSASPSIPQGKAYAKTGTLLFEYWYIFAGLASLIILALSYAVYTSRKSTKTLTN